MRQSENPALLAVRDGMTTTSYCCGDFFPDFTAIGHIAFEPRLEDPGVSEIVNSDTGTVIGYTRDPDEVMEVARQFALEKEEAVAEEFLQSDI
jgi:hypothetical protein